MLADADIKDMKTKIYENLADLYSLWRDIISGEKGHEKQEADFIVDVFKRHSDQIRKVIDLGGGIGLHSDLLLRLGYDVTLLDQSKKALTIAKQNHPKLNLICDSFEEIDIKEKYDAAICMWSTAPYICSKEGRKVFYNWLKTHVRKVIILDEANFYTYPQEFHKVYLGEDGENKIKIVRDWIITKENLRKTKYLYEIFNKKSNKTKIIKDAENQQYLSVEILRKYLGSDWKLQYLFGDYSLQSQYNQKKSPRIITVFQKN